jgi:hypothetical protein
VSKIIKLAIFTLVILVMLVSCKTRIYRDQKLFVIKSITIKNKYDEHSRIVAVLNLNSLDAQDSVYVAILPKELMDKRHVVGDTILVDIETLKISDMDVAKTYNYRQ